MFHEEKIINGVLMWRSTPNGEWLPVSLEVVTKRLIEERELARQLQQRVEELSGPPAFLVEALNSGDGVYRP